MAFVLSHETAKDRNLKRNLFMLILNTVHLGISLLPSKSIDKKYNVL